MQRSFIREILDNTTNSSISFAGGLPNVSIFPNQELQKSATKVFDDKHLLQYSSSLGFLPLKEKIAQLYCDEGFETKPQNILITSGSQQALDIISRYYQNKTITIESPSYLGAMNIFSINNMKQNAIKLNDDGIDIKEFEESFKNTRLSYLIPDYQNPTGKTYSNDSRDEVSKIVEKYDGIIIEDSPYRELYFEKKYKTISQDLPNNSYLLGSFSKTLAPSFRIGWIRADEKLLEPLISYKEVMDLHTNNLSQYILSDYLEDKSKYKKHLSKLRRFYNRKMKIFCCELDEVLPNFEYTKPKGGMFVYGKLKDIDTKNLVNKTMKKDTYFVPGSEFYKDNASKDEIRFNFTNATSKNIKKGLSIISQTIKEE